MRCAGWELPECNGWQSDCGVPASDATERFRKGRLGSHHTHIGVGELGRPRWPHKPEIAFKWFKSRLRDYWSCSSLVERFLDMEEVGGSIPLTTTQ